MRKLGVWPKCRYPGFSKEPLQVFEDLAHDLNFASDFTSGNAAVLAAAATVQKVQDDAKHDALTAGYQGQTRQVAEIRSLFKQGRYAEVIKIFRALPAPQLLTDAELRLVDIARRNAA